MLDPRPNIHARVSKQPPFYPPEQKEINCGMNCIQAAFDKRQGISVCPKYTLKKKPFNHAKVCVKSLNKKIKIKKKGGGGYDTLYISWCDKGTQDPLFGTDTLKHNDQEVGALSK